MIKRIIIPTGITGRIIRFAPNSIEGFLFGTADGVDKTDLKIGYACKTAEGSERYSSPNDQLNRIVPVCLVESFIRNKPEYKTIPFFATQDEKKEAEFVKAYSEKDIALYFTSGIAFPLKVGKNRQNIEVSTNNERSDSSLDLETYGELGEFFREQKRRYNFDTKFRPKPINLQGGAK